MATILIWFSPHILQKNIQINKKEQIKLPVAYIYNLRDKGIYEIQFMCKYVKYIWKSQCFPHSPCWSWKWKDCQEKRTGKPHPEWENTEIKFKISEIRPLSVYWPKSAWNWRQHSLEDTTSGTGSILGG